MPLFRKPLARSAPARHDPGPALRSTISGVTVLEGDGDLVRPDPRAQLLRIVAEAVVLQDRAADVVAAIRRREPLGEVAPRGGPLATRFFALRRGLPRPDDPALARQCELAAVLLDHHGTLLVTALEMLAADWRSPVIAAQLEQLDGLGAPAARLDALYAELAR